MVQRIICATIAASAMLLATARAADLPSRALPPLAPPAFSWAGFYLGANVGAGIIDTRAEGTCINAAGIFGGPGCPVRPSRRLDGTGVVGGATAGYNLQIGNVVIGAEADIQGSSTVGRATAAGPFAFVQPFTIGPFTLLSTPASASASARERMNYFATVRGRLGYVFDRVLFYVTGGVIFTELDHAVAAVTPAAFPLPASTFLPRRTTNEVGGIIGGGIEYAFTDHWTAKLEGLYYALGDKTIFGTEINNSIRGQIGAKFEPEGEIVRVGVNYKF